VANNDDDCDDDDGDGDAMMGTSSNTTTSTTNRSEVPPHHAIDEGFERISQQICKNISASAAEQQAIIEHVQNDIPASIGKLLSLLFCCDLTGRGMMEKIGIDMKRDDERFISHQSVDSEEVDQLGVCLNRHGLRFRRPLTSGNMFDAVADQVVLLGLQQRSAKELSNRVYDKLRTYGYLKNYLFIATMGSLGSGRGDAPDGDHVCLLLLAEILERRIHVVSEHNVYDEGEEKQLDDVIVIEPLSA
jgi:hypothetical protein